MATTNHAYNHTRLFPFSAQLGFRFLSSLRVSITLRILLELMHCRLMSARQGISRCYMLVSLCSYEQYVLPVSLTLQNDD
jgi:hypothetical protein